MTPDRARRLLGRGLLAAIAMAVGAVVNRRAVLSRVGADRRHPLPRPPAQGTFRLSVVIPAYLESERIEHSLARLRTALAGIDGERGIEVIVVDDGSSDDTAERARAAADQVIVLPTNQGKGAAVRAGALVARGRTIAFIDADLSYPPEQLLRLLAEVEGGFDVVVGSRKHVEATTLVRGRRLRELSGRVFNALTLAVLLGHYRDTQCGIKAFRSDVARLLFSRARIDGFAFDVELFHLIEHYRLSLREVPVALANTERSTVRVGLDAVRMVRDLGRVRRWAKQGRYDVVPDGPDLIQAGLH